MHERESEKDRFLRCLLLRSQSIGIEERTGYFWDNQLSKTSTREGGRHEVSSTQATQDRKKLLKRTRSLAVISEDESRNERDARHFRLGQSTFDLPRRYQLIPRAKLIDRNTLKDRLSKSQQHLSDSYERFNEAKSYHSRSACGLHSIPSSLPPFPDPLSYPSRCNRPDPDRLNILHWPESPRRYRSVQALDTVSDFVDIVEDSWPAEGNRSIDCMYTQVKRKRKEHRSLDSILFEDEGELEYFDVLNLLPLSNVRLEFDEEDSRSKNFSSRSGSSAGFDKLKSLEYFVSRVGEERSSPRHNATDEEKCKKSSVKEGDSSQDSQEDEQRQQEREDEEEGVALQTPTDNLLSGGVKHALDEEVVVPGGKRVDQRVEEAEDCKSIWISDSDEHEDMSRRPQVLKVVDNDVTKRQHRRMSEVDSVTKEEQRNDSESVKKTEVSFDEKSIESVEDAKNFFEQRGSREENVKGRRNEGRFERIVKGTSSILGKACNVVKGSLGFEARSESSDLGLGSESGSDTRRRSVDDGVDEDVHESRAREETSSSNSKKNLANDKKKTNGSLTRSKSCVDSIECQDDGQEFDHVRYKIVKSNMFGKNIYNSSRGDVTYEGLMQYLREYSFQELLLDNNVVIIEPVRAETVERKPSTVGKARSEPSCKIAGATQKKTSVDNRERNCTRNYESADSVDAKSPKLSSIRKHFFYHPIRVNRELIDEELPDPDTVRNVRRMFEDTLKTKNTSSSRLLVDCCKNRIDDTHFDETSGKGQEEFRCSSKAKDLTKLFENMEKSTSSDTSVTGCKDELDSSRCESKTRILAQTFEARSGHTSPSDSTSCKNKANRYHHHHHNWDAGSVSSGVSSDYPDTDAGSGVQCISSEDEEVGCQEYETNDTSSSSHYVSQDVLKKIRECGTSITYYGGKVVNSSNGPLIAPPVENRFKRVNGANDYVKFRLVKSNSCDSRLELTGRLVENHLRHRSREKTEDLSRYTIAETPSIEITPLDKQERDDKTFAEDEDESTKEAEVKREPPIVIGLEPKREEDKEAKGFKAEFKLGDMDDAKSNYANRFVGSALNRWQINESNWKTTDEFGKMEFEEFEVLEDSLNGNEGERVESS